MRQAVVGAAKRALRSSSTSSSAAAGVVRPTLWRGQMTPAAAGMVGYSVHGSTAAVSFPAGFVVPAAGFSSQPR